jgi:hypothetical protein
MIRKGFSRQRRDFDYDEMEASAVRCKFIDDPDGEGHSSSPFAY